MAEQLAEVITESLDSHFPKNRMVFFTVGLVLVMVWSAYDALLKEPTQDLSLTLLREGVKVLENKVDTQTAIHELTIAVRELTARLEKQENPDASYPMQTHPVRPSDDRSDVDHN